jgi:hypothetical protein
LNNIGAESGCQGKRKIYLNKKMGDAAWDDCIALVPVAVLTPATKNREQEVI